MKLQILHLFFLIGAISALMLPLDSSAVPDNTLLVKKVVDNEVDNHIVMSGSEKIAIILLAIVIGVFGFVVGFFAPPLMVFSGLALLGCMVSGVLLGLFAAWVMRLSGGRITTESIASVLQSMDALRFMNLLRSGLPPTGAVASVVITKCVLFHFHLL